MTRRTVLAIAAGTLAIALGAAGLIRAAVPQSSAAPPAPGMISVVGAYVVAPVPPTRLAAAYFTVYNTTAKADRLIGVQTGAGGTATLHAVEADGAMDDVGAVTIPAHGSLPLRVGQGHVMIGELYGTIRPGQSVDMTLQFAHAGTIAVTAPVLAVGHTPSGPGRSADSGAASGQSSMSDMSGDH